MCDSENAGELLSPGSCQGFPGRYSQQSYLLPTGAAVTDPKTISFHYVKSGQFRSIHVDGAIGGPLPQGGGLSMALFSERMPIPQRVETELLEDASLGKEVDRSGRTGVIRELEIVAILSIAAAARLHAWLGEKLSEEGRIESARVKK